MLAVALALEQNPPQHSRSALHASPTILQYEGEASHTPSTQYFEQHCALSVQGLPEVLHSRLSAAHVPLVQVPPQHSPSLAHACASAVHWLEEHLPLTHAKVQQSVFTAQAAPPARHSLPSAVQS